VADNSVGSTVKETAASGSKQRIPEKRRAPQRGRHAVVFGGGVTKKRKQKEKRKKERRDVLTGVPTSAQRKRFFNLKGKSAAGKLKGA